MSSHQNSAYNSEQWLRVPARALSNRRYSTGTGRSAVKATAKVSRPPDQIWASTTIIGQAE